MPCLALTFTRLFASYFGLHSFYLTLNSLIPFFLLLGLFTTNSLHYFPGTALPAIRLLLFFTINPDISLTFSCQTIPPFEESPDRRPPIEVLVESFLGNQVGKARPYAKASRIRTYSLRCGQHISSCLCGTKPPPALLSCSNNSSFEMNCYRPIVLLWQLSMQQINQEVNSYSWVAYPRQ